MKLKYGDYIIIGLVVLLAAGALLLGMGSKLATGGETAEVYQNGKLVRVVKLAELTAPVQFELDGAYRDTIRAEKGRIRFLDATCPDKVCVNTGWISSVGQTAACVPNRVLIKIVGAGTGPDVVVR